MKHLLLLLSFLIGTTQLFAQLPVEFSIQKPVFYEIKSIRATPVKNQAATGTCWCFSTVSLIESEGIRKSGQELDLSEMFIVYNIYIEKAKNYILRQGNAQFSEGGLSHDMIRAVANYGVVPESAYTGLVNGQTSYNHQRFFSTLKSFLDSVLKKQPVDEVWMNGYKKLLDQYMGKPPVEFNYKGKKYSPLSFATEVVKFDANDYVSLTSFTHQPFYMPFVLQIPDNFANGSFYNLPLKELMGSITTAVNKGYSVAWDADVSNKGFRQDLGLALNFDPAIRFATDLLVADMEESTYSAAIRQELFENLTTQDDHLMHIVGIEKSKEGKTFFLVKNSWGSVGPFDGYINVSEAYIAINTISIVLPKAALSKELLSKLNNTN